jgi:hypothetical protein
LTEVIPSAEEFVRLRSSKDPAEYQRAAADNAPLNVWHDVLHRFPAYRRWVAHNKTVPIEILTILAKDSDSEVRWHVASKNKLTVELIEALADDPDETVRSRIVRHKRLPLSVLERMRHDPSEVVRAAAAERLSHWKH